MVKIGNPWPAVQQQKPPPELPPTPDATELSKIVKEAYKRRNGGKSPDASSNDGTDDEEWEQSSNKYVQGYTAEDLRELISSMISFQWS